MYLSRAAAPQEEDTTRREARPTATPMRAEARCAPCHPQIRLVAPRPERRPARRALPSPERPAGASLRPNTALSPAPRASLQQGAALCAHSAASADRAAGAIGPRALTESVSPAAAGGRGRARRLASAQRAVKTRSPRPPSLAPERAAPNAPPRAPRTQRAPPPDRARPPMCAAHARQSPVNYFRRNPRASPVPIPPGYVPVAHAVAPPAPAPARDSAVPLPLSSVGAAHAQPSSALLPPAPAPEPRRTEEYRSAPLPPAQSSTF
jgi:hypothetical protein